MSDAEALVCAREVLEELLDAVRLVEGVDEDAVELGEEDDDDEGVARRDEEL